MFSGRGRKQSRETTGRTVRRYSAAARKAAVTDRQPYPTPRRGKELVTRLLTGVCDICGQQAESVEVHHIRKLADLDKGGASPPAWAELMARRRRKTLVVCLVRHGGIHVGQPAA